MKQLTCEMCGSTDLIKQEGLFVCQSCGCKYSAEEAQKMMVEGTVEVKGTVKVDTSGELANLYQLARRAKDNGSRKDAAKYYDMILLKDAGSWEATFYNVCYELDRYNVTQIESAGIFVGKNIGTVLKLIKDNVANKDEQKEAYTEVANKVIYFASLFFEAAKKQHKGRNGIWLWKYEREMWRGEASAAINCAYALGDNLDLLFKTDSEANNLSVAAWKQGVAWHDYLKKKNIGEAKNYVAKIPQYAAKIQQYDSSYVAPSTGGCYVATAVYGSYDCPQVWTLRRYRDYTLAETWYGRAFIRTYYAVSPTLVKWFGHTEWFKKMWQGKLDRMVEKLQSEGVESTPYEDRKW